MKSLFILLAVSFVTWTVSAIPAPAFVPEYTGEIAVHIPGEHIDVASIAQRHGLEYVGRIGNLKEYYLFRDPYFDLFSQQDNPLDSALTQRYDLEDHYPSDIPEPSVTSLHLPHFNLSLSDEIQWYQHQVTYQRLLRSAEGSLPEDPLYAQQWHLHGTGQNLNVEKVWQSGVRGEGVTVAIVDDGMKFDHPDLQPNFFRDGSLNVRTGNKDPSPLMSWSRPDEHGTASAGCAAARDNNVCGVGVAPRAKVAGIKMLEGSSGITEAQEARAVSHNCDDVPQDQMNMIFSCSWGPDDRVAGHQGPSRAVQDAIRQCVQNGRNGLGTIYVWAGGNGRGANDNQNYDGYVNNPYTISIGAVDRYGDVTRYGEPGACLMAVAPSSGTHDLITSTGVQGCNTHFSGTSAAAPMAAGFVALLLQVNPNLTWRDVQHVIVRTSRKEGLDRGPNRDGWKQNGAGLWFSHDFGFGLLNAEAAVEAAKSWKNVPNLVSWSSPISSYKENDPLGKIQGITTFQYQVTANSNTRHALSKMRLESVQLYVDAVFPTTRSDCEVVLISPSGVESYLQLKHKESWSNRRIKYNIDWTFMSLAYWGENVLGTWQVRLDYPFAQQSGRMNRWQITFNGYIDA
ncbi:Proprotein convertase subtilisin/kexin type 7 [Balamuthia mandrillaris]